MSEMPEPESATDLQQLFREDFKEELTPMRIPMPIPIVPAA